MMCTVCSYEYYDTCPYVQDPCDMAVTISSGGFNAHILEHSLATENNPKVRKDHYPWEAPKYQCPRCYRTKE